MAGFAPSVTPDVNNAQVQQTALNARPQTVGPMRSTNVFATKCTIRRTKHWNAGFVRVL
jgi:hypothetical protein